MSLALEHVLAFLDDATSLLRGMVGVAPLDATKQASATKDPGATISIVVHARGDLAGFTWSFPESVAARVAEHMVPGIQPDPSICEAAAAELANVLTGRGLATLADRGVIVDIEPPQISTGDEQGATYVLGTDAGSISVTFHQAGPSPSNAARLALASMSPPVFTGGMFVVDGMGQIVRAWNETSAGANDVFAALDVDASSPAGVAIHRSLARAVGAQTSAWASVAAELPALVACRDGSSVAAHWQPVDSAGQVIGVTMFVLPTAKVVRDDAMTVLSAEALPYVASLREAGKLLGAGDRGVIGTVQRAVRHLSDAAERARLDALNAQCGEARRAADTIAREGRVDVSLLGELAALCLQVELYMAVHREARAAGASALVASAASASDARLAADAVRHATPTLAAALQSSDARVQRRALAALADTPAMFQPAA